MRALIVDDSRFARDYLRNLLEHHAVECCAAEHGRAALECLGSSGPFDVALVDWNMPVMGGLELVQAMRSDHALDGTRILMVTTEAENDFIFSALEAGADEYLIKPFDEEGLIDKLQMIGFREI